MKIETSEKKGTVALCILALGFALIALVARYLADYFSLFQQLYVSLGVGFILSLFFFERTLTLTRVRQIPRRDWMILILRVIIGYVIAASLYRQSLVLTKISNVTFIQSIPFAAVFGWILFKEKFTWTKFTLILIAYFGVVLIAVKDFSSITSIGVGELFSLISAALFSLSFISRKWQSNFLNDQETTQILLFLVTVIIAGISLLAGEGLPILTLTWSLSTVLLLNGFFNVINMFLINYGFKHVKVVLASNILTLESVLALILAFIFYQELPNLRELMGGVLILTSVIQMNRLEEKS